MRKRKRRLPATRSLACALGEYLETRQARHGTAAICESESYLAGVASGALAAGAGVAGAGVAGAGAVSAGLAGLLPFGGFAA